MEEHLGLIIIFYNDEKRLDTAALSKLSTIFSSCQTCMVNNGSQDNTFQKLLHIKEYCEGHVSVIDMKKHKSLNVALKAGIRYLKSKNEQEMIGYIESKRIKDFNDFSENFEIFIANEINLNGMKFKNENQSHYCRNLLRNVFSIHHNLRSSQV